MKKYTFIIIVIVSSFLATCNKDDEKPLIVQTDDFNVEIFVNAAQGDTIGIVPGTSNNGTVNYSITSQSPDGILTIGETYGELIVASDAVSNLSIGSKITLEVSVGKGGISQISNVEVTVIPPPVDISPWIGTLDVFEEGFGSVQVTSTKIDEVTIELGGPDPFDLFCSNENTILITFGSLTSATEGSVTIERQSFPCYDGTEVLEGTGTFNTETKVITLDFTFNDSWGGTKVITPVE